MDEYDDEDEVEIFIEPREDVLQQHGISIEEFEDALGDAIDAYHEQADRLEEDEDGPGIGEMPVTIGDREFRLDELADIQIADESE